MIDRMKDQRSKSVSVLSDAPLHFRAISWSKSDPGECAFENNLSQYKLWNQHVHVHSLLRLSGCVDIMVELAFYPAVALIYFFGVMNASKEDRVELDDRASMNVFCLFVLAQPLCLVLGAYTGMATYLITALVSYNFLPWKEAKPPVEEKKRKKKTKWGVGT